MEGPAIGAFLLFKEFRTWIAPPCSSMPGASSPPGPVPVRRIEPFERLRVRASPIDPESRECKPTRAGIVLRRLIFARGNPGSRAMTEETARRILKDLEPSLPVPVSQWKVETGPDTAGDDSVHVIAVLRSDEGEDWEFENRMAIRQHVWDAVRAGADGPPPWVYIGFQTVADQVYLKELEEEEAREEEEQYERAIREGQA